jgi:hypothetical protein
MHYAFYYASCKADASQVESYALRCRKGYTSFLGTIFLQEVEHYPIKTRYT